MQNLRVDLIAIIEPNMNYRILLLSAYDAMSHKIWRGRLQEMFPEHEWTQLALPPRHFNWRIRGNSLQWALDEEECLTRDYDLLIATSMVDLASLRGFIPALCELPTIVYFHENQFVYPTGLDQRSSNVEPQLVPLYCAYCSDAIVFNSDYNRSTFLQGAETLLAKLPDRLSPSLLHKLQESEVIPVPLEEIAQTSIPRKPGNILELVWNHRWEYDKGPQLLLQVAEKVLQQRLRIRLHVVGQKFRSSPGEFERIAVVLTQHATDTGIERGYCGFIEDREEYTELLRRCDVVLSTALHDFQGLAIQEACLLGCTPLVPDKLVYPEYIGKQFLYPFAENDISNANCEAVLAQLKVWQHDKSENTALPKAMLNEFSQHSLRPKYAALFERLLCRENR
tara:strand:- start:802 stop:1986 length:1185 start_codon:yes stop_codon:yes gene_type:complete